MAMAETIKMVLTAIGRATARAVLSVFALELEVGGKSIVPGKCTNVIFNLGLNHMIDHI